MNKQLRVIFDIFIGYCLIALSFTFAYLFNEVIGQVSYFLGLTIFCVLNSLAFHYLTLFIHAGAHFNVFPKNRKINDILINMFVGYFFLQPMSIYRKKHFAHHRLVGQMSDQENSHTVSK